jgi:hypothetical protein
MGPIEVSSSFYAGARLAYSCLALHAWGDSLPPSGTWFVLVSRVLDRTPKFPIAILREVLGRLDLVGLDCIVLWSDAGNHCRSKSLLGTCAA